MKFDLIGNNLLCDYYIKSRFICHIAFSGKSAFIQPHLLISKYFSKMLLQVFIKKNKITYLTKQYTFNICSFSDANNDTEPNTSLNNFRYKLEFSTFAVRKVHVLYNALWFTYMYGSYVIAQKRFIL